MQEISQDDFQIVDESITTQMLDNEVAKLKDLQQYYEECKKISDTAHGAYEEQRKYLISLLTKAGKKKYEAEGIGLISVISKLKVSYPKDIDNQKAFIEFIKGRFGEDGIAGLMTVNYNTLNSFYNEEFQQAIDRGENVSEFTIPGLPQPEESKTLSFRKSK